MLLAFEIADARRQIRPEQTARRNGVGERHVFELRFEIGDFCTKCGDDFIFRVHAER